ncbi:hypothetical protein MTR67_016576, partial [Solanum verrucosum]
PVRQREATSKISRRESCPLLSTSLPPLSRRSFSSASSSCQQQPAVPASSNQRHRQQPATPASSNQQLRPAATSKSQRTSIDSQQQPRGPPEPTATTALASSNNKQQTSETLESPFLSSPAKFEFEDGSHQIRPSKF